VHFRKEKYVPRGGPDGGDGGRGGDVVVYADPQLNTLLELRHHQRFVAENGGAGGRQTSTGKNGASIIIKVPVGTRVFDKDEDQLLADLAVAGDRLIAAEGGEGGWGNARFVTSVRQAPKHAERGAPGRVRRLKLELALLADVGLVGLPNAGKSTFLASVSAARPKIADYPFTTLEPQLGVVRLDDERNFVLADLPGLIEGASGGVGLGHQFLRHVERCQVLLHLVDISDPSCAPNAALEVISSELAAYSETLTRLPRIVAATKMDLNPDSAVLAALQTAAQEQGLKFFAISAATHQNLRPLLEELWKFVADRRQDAPQREPHEFRPLERRHWDAYIEDGQYFVEGNMVDEVVAQCDLQNKESVRHLEDRLERLGIMRQLRRLGIQEGDTVHIGNVEFDYEDRGEGRKR
jgi:GTP-binding protein